MVNYALIFFRKRGVIYNMYKSKLLRGNAVKSTKIVIYDKNNVISDFKKYNDKSALNDAIEIVERIRKYWMEKD